MSEENKDGKGSFWVGLMIGGFVSLGLIILLGSERGKKLLQKFQDEGIESLLGDAKDEVEEKVEILKEKGAELAEKGQEFLDQSKNIQKEVVDTVTEAKADAAEIIAEKVDETLSHIEAIQEHGRQSTADLRRQLFKNIPKKT